MKRDFNKIIEGLKTSITGYDYYTDFNKVFSNIEKYLSILETLNSLIGSKDINGEFISIIKNNPKILEAIPLLLATRETKIEIVDGINIKYDFKNRNLADDEYAKFMKNTKLFDLLGNSKISNLHDYMVGVEVGLDSNGRKNRGGNTMNEIVKSFILKVPNIQWDSEMTKSHIKDKYKIDLDDLIYTHSGDRDVQEKNKADKRFDFVVKTINCFYLIETNFYSSSGSKLNETARSFKSLAKDFKNIDNVAFVWITDGKGWKSAKTNLKEAYDEIEHIYTIEDLENGILLELFK